MSAPPPPLGPADLPQLVQVLQAALSADGATRVPAEAMLKQQESRAGFFALLTEVILGYATAPENVSFLAATTFKAGIKRGWRRRAPSAGDGVGDDERAFLRGRLLELLEVSVPLIAAQIAELLAAVARHEWPAAWPELVPHMIARLNAHAEGGNAPMVLLTLRALHRVVKMFANKKMPADRRAFSELAPPLFEVLAPVCVEQTDALLRTAAASPSAEAAAEGAAAAEVALLTGKMLRRSLADGLHAAWAERPPCVELVGACAGRIENLHSLRATLEGWGEGALVLRGLVSRVAAQFMRLLVDLQQESPPVWCRTELMQPTLALCMRLLDAGFGAAVLDGTSVQQITADSVEWDEGEPAEPVESRYNRRSTIGALEYVRVLLAYATTVTDDIERRSIDDVNTANVAVDAADAPRAAAASLFDGEVTQNLLCVLVGRFLTLTPTDLRRWDEDAEQFAFKEECENWRDDVRPCAHNLLITLVDRWRPFVAPTLLAILQGAAGVQARPPSPHATATSWQTPPVCADWTTALSEAGGGAMPAAVMEGCLRAAGLCAHAINEELDFERWYGSVLLPMMRGAMPHSDVPPPVSKAVQRRAILLVAYWVPDISAAVRQSLYSELLTLLGAEDMAVALAPVIVLRTMIDDMTFTHEELQPFAEPTLSALVALLQRSANSESQHSILSLLSLIVERLGATAARFATQLLALLPAVWESAIAADNAQPLQRAVIATMAHLTRALGGESVVLHPFSIALVRTTCDLAQPLHVYLLEEGLELWDETLQNAPHLTAELLALLPIIPPLLQRDHETIFQMTAAMRSYLLLGGAGGADTLAAVGTAWSGCGLSDHLAAALTDLRPSATPVISDVLELGVHVFGASGAVCALLSVPLRQAMVSLLMSEDGDVLATAAYLQLAARMLVLAPERFEELIGALAASTSGQTSDSALRLRVLDQQLAQIAGGSAYLVWRRKLGAAAVCHLMPPTPASQGEADCGAQLSSALERLPKMLHVVCKVIAEAENTEEEDVGGGIDDSYTNGASGEAAPRACEAARKRQLFSADLAHSLALRELLKARLQALSTMVGASWSQALGDEEQRLLSALASGERFEIDTTRPRRWSN